MSLVVCRKREHLPRFLKAKLRPAGMPQQACFTCKTSQNVSAINATRLEYRHVQQKQLHSQVGARSATFWKRHAHSPRLDNNLQICCLTECASFFDLSWDWSLSGALRQRKQSLYVLVFFFLLSFTPLPSSMCFCLWATSAQGIHPRRVGTQRAFSS